MSTCAYGYTRDENKIKGMLTDMKINLKENNKSDADIQQITNNWLNHDAKRIYIPNMYDFMVQTIGVYTNIEIIDMAITILNNGFDSIKQNIMDNKYEFMENNTINNNTVDIKLDNIKYTKGKVIEYILHEKYYKIFR